MPFGQPASMIEDDDEDLADYVDWCRAAGHRPGTIRQRILTLRRVPNRRQADRRQLLVWLAQHDWAPETRKAARSALRSYYQWALASGLRDDDPTATLPSVRVPRGRPKAVPDDVFARAMARGTDRERLMLGLAGWAGLRRAEIAGLRWSAYRDGRLRIRGKGGVVRSVLVSQRLGRLLEEEQDRRRDGRMGSGWRYGNPSSPFIFPGRSGDSANPWVIGDTLKRCLGPEWSGHKLRHRFATKAYAVQRDLFVVQALLGHASPATTAVYVALPVGAEHAAVEAAAA